MLTHSNFGFEKRICIHDSKNNEVKFYMRPLKVKELGDINRIIELQEQEQWADVLPIIMQLISEAIIDVEIEDDWIVEELIEAFMRLNFEDNLPDIKKKHIDKTDNREELAKAIDFLLSQGHLYSDILEYTIPQLILFQNTAINRLFGKTKGKLKNPIDVLSKIGIPIQQKK